MLRHYPLITGIAFTVGPAALVALAGCATAAPAPALDQAPTASPPRPQIEHPFLTWQRDPTTTMTVQWIDSAPLKPLSAGQSEQVPPRQVPHVGRIDPGASPDWIERGLKLAFLAEPDTHTRPASDDLNATAHLGWNEDGLLVHVEVTDDVFLEAENIGSLWQGDGIELFVSTAVGSRQSYQLLIAPGADPAQQQPRHHFVDRRQDAQTELEVSYDVTVRDDGYRIHVLLPWANLGIDAQQGTELALQLYINDRDDWDQPRRHLIWHPLRQTHQNPYAVKPLKLADRAGDPVRGRIITDRAAEDRVVEVYGPAELAGQTVTLRATDLELTSATFQAHQRVARAEVQLPQPPRDGRWGTLHAYIDDQRLHSVAPPEVLGRDHEAVGPAELVYFEAGSDDRQRVRTQMIDLGDYWPGHYIQRIELTGLEPDTRYRFRAEGYDGEYGFRTMPATLDRPLRFAAGGDTRHRKQWMVRTNRVAMAYKPDFIVWGGDLAYADGRQDRLYRWVEWFEANDQTLIDEQGDITPILVAIGNHEVQGGYYYNHDDFEPTDPWRLSVAPYFYRLFAFPGHPGYGVMDFGDYLSIILLDSAHTNPVEGEQAEWLDGVLAERRQVPHVFPVYHVTGFPSHRNFDGRVESSIREHWVPLFERHGVQVAFENHDHTYKRTVPIRDGRPSPDGVVYIGDGAWGVGTRSVHDPAQTWYLDHAEGTRHAIIVTLHGTHRHFLVVSEDGEVIDEYPRTPRPAAQVPRP